MAINWVWLAVSMALHSGVTILREVACPTLELPDRVTRQVEGKRMTV